MKILVVTFLLLLVFGWCEARLENEIKAENTTGPGFADQWRKCKKGEYIIKAFQIQVTNHHQDIPNSCNHHQLIPNSGNKPSSRHSKFR